MKNLHVVMGGLGKNIIFTSLIPSLCEKDTDKVSIMTPWPFVFNSNERVESIEHPMGWEYYSNLSKYDNIIYHEPYLSNYIKTEKFHILDAWADMYGIEKVFPKPYINIKLILELHYKNWNWKKIASNLNFMIDFILKKLKHKHRIRLCVQNRFESVRND